MKKLVITLTAVMLAACGGGGSSINDVETYPIAAPVIETKACIDIVGVKQIGNYVTAHDCSTGLSLHQGTGLPDQLVWKFTNYNTAGLVETSAGGVLDIAHPNKVDPLSFKILIASKTVLSYCIMRPTVTNNTETSIPVSCVDMIINGI